eukprot:5187326-Alexandrium_andersonii.AAC.1
MSQLSLRKLATQRSWPTSGSSDSMGTEQFSSSAFCWSSPRLPADPESAFGGSQGPTPPPKHAQAGRASSCGTCAGMRTACETVFFFHKH